MATSDYKYNPFTGNYFPVSVTGEEHTVEFFSDKNAYGIKMQNAVYKNTPSTVTITENVTGGSTFTEVGFSVSPSAGQYRVDYDTNEQYGSGFIEFNSSDNGTAVTVDYESLGTLLSTANIPKLVDNNTFTGNNTFSGTVTMSSSASVAGTFDNTSSTPAEFTGGINVGASGEIQHNGTPVAMYLDDGTPVYCKSVTVTVASGFSSGSATHGISGNIMTNNLVVGFICYADLSSSVGSFSAYSQDSIESANYVRVNDTNAIIDRTSSGGPIDYIVMIWYKQ